jgi:hypothetical protein
MLPMNRSTIQKELQRIRQQLRGGDESEVWIWVIPSHLACAQRPLRDHPQFGGRSPLPSEARPLVERWVDRFVEAGFRSVISLLEVAQLDRYYVRGGINLHPHGLLGYYESRGLSVESIPCTDYQKPTSARMGQVLEAFRHLPKPVLLHCSAGIDRTAPVAAFLYEECAAGLNKQLLGG